MSKNYYDDVEFAEEYASESDNNEDEDRDEDEGNDKDEDDEGDNNQEEAAPFILRNAIEQHDDNC
ncbi:MAG TPA: hypothetical protein VGE40_10010 [Bacilli bacterium]